MEKNFRVLRQKIGVNQEDFWRKVGITQSGGSRYETGRRIPEPVKTLLALAYGSDAEAKEMYDRLRRPLKPE
ncbi:MAG: helix-turn-helix domain-containing protein [Burkholderiales bacterium]|jgi:transcriptional regulator with XRE-family HTH domain|nr:helix-turn-helix domain-containing protein [Burkholderiales bacterium]